MKEYVKPTIEFIELRPEERLANNSSGNCRSCQGTPSCAPGGLHGGGQ